MPKTYIVKQGEDLSSIAEKHGFFWETVWDHPDNAELKKLRKNPNVLMRGDEVVIPELELKWEHLSTNRRHRFRTKGVPVKITLRLRRGGSPRAGVRWEIHVGDEILEGTTDKNGELTANVYPSVSHAVLVLKEGELTERRTIRIGHLNPVDNISGLQQRLRSLGYNCEVTGEMDDESRTALRRFQADASLDDSGELDDDTREELLNVHQR